jgi:hypothetical protein
MTSDGLFRVAQAQIEALEERSRAEIAHWEKEKARLEAALRRARGG